MKKKLAQVISAAVLSVAFIGTAAGAQGAAGCSNFSITGTGAGSNNTIVCNDVKEVTITCESNVTVANFSYQDGKTGPAQVGGNTNGGTAVSGSVTNSNGVDLQFGVACGTPAEETVTPVTPGNGGTTPTPAPAKPVALPNTAGTDATTIVMVSLVAAAGVVALSRLAVAAYNRFGNK